MRHLLAALGVAAGAVLSARTGLRRPAHAQHAGWLLPRRRCGLADLSRLLRWDAFS
jgi:hypothetical protein